MTNLQARNEATLSSLNDIQESIQQLQLQLESLNKKFTEATKIANAQANLTKQWKEAIAPLKGLLQKACRVYGDPDAINEMVQDIQDLADLVVDNFQNHQSEENEFVDKVEIPEADNILPASDDEVEIVEPEKMPSPGDDITILTEKQASELISHLDKTQIKKLAVLNDLGTSTAVRSIAKKLVEHGFTRYRLESNLSLIVPRQLSLVG
jgi:DNA repair exonuclease SbcCD ATPase subunit